LFSKLLGTISHQYLHLMTMKYLTTGVLPEDKWL